jgi:hypothetical protein
MAQVKKKVPFTKKYLVQNVEKLHFFIKIVIDTLNFFE